MNQNLIVYSRFVVQPYGRSVILIVAHDAIREHNRRAKKFGVKPEQSKGFRALTVFTNLGVSYLFFGPKLTHNDIAHEIKHSVDYIMDYIGAKPLKGKFSKLRRDALAEPEAYLTGYIHQRVYKILSKSNIPIGN